MTAIRAAGDPPVVLLHCVSNYPADPRDANLRAMRTMADAFGVAVGYSDHTPGDEVAIAAVVLGACIVEKHVTLDRSLPGPDHAASMEPRAFAELVRKIRVVEGALGDGRKQPAASEREIAAVARKSLVAAVDIHEGELVTREVVAIRRPGTGLAPSRISGVVGRRARCRIAAGTLLTEEMLG